MTNQELIDAAQDGNAAPLLAKLKAGVPTSPKSGPGDLDGSHVTDMLWYDVLAADLPADVMQECYDAVGAQ